MTTSDQRPLAVVTGASSGIGLELAKQFAQHDFDLVIAAEDAELDTAATTLRDLGATVEAVRVDLTTEGGVAELFGRVQSRAVDALCLNAGVGAGGGRFIDVPIADHLRVIDLNIRGTVHLAHLVISRMVERGEGRVLITSSIASTQPGTFQSTYNASKSFDQAFALAIREELDGTGVTVTSLMPGPTDTEFFERANLEDTKLGQSSKDDPADVARDGFEAMMKGDERVVSASMMTKLQGRAGRFLPDGVKSKLHGSMAEPGSGS
jgi:short-subunit dehydrogenase